MNSSLCRLLREGEKANIGKTTLCALRDRGLVDLEGQLTDTGRIYALSFCPLNEQSAFLGIPLTEIEISRNNKRPEFDLLEFYKKEGWVGSFSEGGIVFVLLYAMWFDTLFAYAMKKWNGNREYVKASMYNVYSYNMFLDDFPQSTNDLLSTTREIPTKRIISNFKTIKSWQYSDTWFPYGYYGITESLVLSIFECLGRQRLEKITSIFLKDRWLFSKGWPDLLLIRNDVLRFVEVKTSDKLHVSQLIVMPTMMAGADLKFEIVRIKNV